MKRVTERTSNDGAQPLSTFVLKTYNILNVMSKTLRRRKTHQPSPGTTTVIPSPSKTFNYSSPKYYLYTFGTTNTKASFDR
jgi:hypothetical protein